MKMTARGGFAAGCRTVGVLLITGAMALRAFAQAPPALISPEVSPDHRVTFRFRAPNAKEVFLNLEGATRQAMQKDEQGVWSITTQPLEPDLYGYSFATDGVNLIDPSNPVLKPNLLNLSSMVHVPGPSSLLWEVTSVPRGTVHRHFYRSEVVGSSSEFFVYTPPGYDPAARKLYPVLYLLHGFSDDSSAWTAVGRAHVILDNLIAQQKAREMLVVMPLGYGDLAMVSRATAGMRDAGLRQRSFDKFRDALLTEIVPAVEKHYRISTDPSSRAIAGLSMGGAESLFVGLNAPNRFAWIGAFSSGGLPEFATAFPTLDARVNSQVRLLWVACGTEDRLIDGSRKLGEWLKSKNVRHTAIETPGAHTWMVWRRNLATFAALLFPSEKMR